MSGPKRSITTQKVLDECVKGEGIWAPLEAVVQAALPTVPPGKALRHFESKTKRTTKPEWTEDQKIRSGQRHFVMAAIRTLTASRQIEVQTTPEGQMIRIAVDKPAIVPLDTCPHCLRPYDQPEEAMPPFSQANRAKVIFPPQFNQRRFG